MSMATTEFSAASLQLIAKFAFLLTALELAQDPDLGRIAMSLVMTSKFFRALNRLDPKV